ncbi:MAG: MFS transporter [Chloroflexi bacterium]|nr:MFS transporter [Chloroflexota bacterium]
MNAPIPESAGAFRAGLSGVRQRGLLVALPFMPFAAQCHFLALSPFLLEIAQESRRDIGTTGQLVTSMAVAWAAASLLGGGLSDRFGRKPILLYGLAVLSTCGLLAAVVTEFNLLMLVRFLGGLGGGVMMPTVLATVGDVFPPNERGKGLSWTMAGMSLAQVAGVPLITFLASVAGWRWSVGGLAVFTLLLVVVAWFLVPSSARRALPQGRGFGPPPLPLLLQPRVGLVMLSGFTERVAYGAVGIYLASFFIESYSVPYSSLAGALMVVAVGNLVGTLIGGPLTDRVSSKAHFVLYSMLATAATAGALLLLVPDLWVSATIGLVWGLVSALGRPAFFWLVTDLTRGARGAVMGLYVATSSLSWTVASMLGGVLIAASGFGSLAGMIVGFNLLCALSLVGLIAIQRDDTEAPLAGLEARAAAVSRGRVE